jgi:hypothetical protein
VSFIDLGLLVLMPQVYFDFVRESRGMRVKIFLSYMCSEVILTKHNHSKRIGNVIFVPISPK